MSMALHCSLESLYPLTHVPGIKSVDHYEAMSTIILYCRDINLLRSTLPFENFFLRCFEKTWVTHFKSKFVSTQCVKIKWHPMLRRHIAKKKKIFSWWPLEFILMMQFQAKIINQHPGRQKHFLRPNITVLEYNGNINVFITK